MGTLMQYVIQKVDFTIFIFYIKKTVPCACIVAKEFAFP
jgi:hypothetical protein